MGDTPKDVKTKQPAEPQVTVSEHAPEPQSFGQAHRTALRWTAVIVVLVLIAGGALYWTVLRPRQHKETQAAQKYETARASARQLDDLGQYDQAADTLSQQRKDLDPKKDSAEYVDTTLALARAKAGAGSYDEAIELFKTIQNDSKHGVDAKQGISKAYLAKGDKAQARTYMQQAVDITRERAKTDPEADFKLTIYESQLNAIPQ